MESSKPENPFADPHKKAQDAIDHAREVREKKLSELGKKAAPSPHFIADGNVSPM
jgi:hypothetical protein